MSDCLTPLAAMVHPNPPTAHLHALQAINASNTITDGQHSTKMNNWWLILFFPLLDGRDKLLGDMINEVLASKFRLTQLIQCLGISSKRAASAQDGLRYESRLLPALNWNLIARQQLEFHNTNLLSTLRESEGSLLGQ